MVPAKPFLGCGGGGGFAFVSPLIGGLICLVLLLPNSDSLGSTCQCSGPVAALEGALKIKATRDRAATKLLEEPAQVVHAFGWLGD